MLQRVTWPSKITLSRGEKGKNEYSTGGEEGETVEVPQIDENLPAHQFIDAFVNVVGNEKEALQIINRRALAEPAIRDGQAKFKASYKKGKVVPVEEATKQAINAIREYVPQLVKERGAFIAEASKAKETMDSLKAARARVIAGDLSQEEFIKMLENAFEEPAANTAA